jgi:hypothetical protein
MDDLRAVHPSSGAAWAGWNFVGAGLLVDLRATDGGRLAAKTGKSMGSSVLISVLITFLVVILVLYLVGMLPIDGRAKQIVRIIVIVIGIISLLRVLAVF